jgi:hypothetical protein
MRQLINCSTPLGLGSFFRLHPSSAFFIPKFALGIPEIMRDALKELKSETLQRRSGGAMN